MITVISLMGGKTVDPRRIYIGRPNPLGNPYPIEKETGTRDEQRASCIAKYEVWLTAEIAAGNERVLWWLDRIARYAADGDVEIACWCAPLPCHGDVVKRVVEERIRAA